MVDAWRSQIVKYQPIRYYSPIAVATDSICDILGRVKALLNAAWMTRLGTRIVTGHSVLLPNLARAILGMEEPLVTAEDGKHVAAALEKIITKINYG